MSSETVAAIDLGGTCMKGGLVREPGELVHAETRDTRREDGPDAVLGRLAGFAADLAALEPVSAVGVAVPGLVDEAEGRAVVSVNLGWRDVALRDRLREHLGLPVAVAHDVRAAALAEGELGAARGCGDWLLVTLGTGVGSAIVLGGRPYGGAHGAGGELGHLVVAPDGPECACGARGCVEALASAGAIGRRAGRPVRDAIAGDDPAWREAISALAAGLAAYCVVMDPERIVIGGGLAAAGDALFAPLAAALEERLTFTPVPPLVPAALGPDAGCHGAALAARRL